MKIYKISETSPEYKGCGAALVRVAGDFYAPGEVLEIAYLGDSKNDFAARKAISEKLAEKPGFVQLCMISTFEAISICSLTKKEQKQAGIKKVEQSGHTFFAFAESEL